MLIVDLEIVEDDMSSLHGNADFDRIDAANDRPVTESLDTTHGIVLALNGFKHWYCIFVPRDVTWGLGNTSYSEALSCWMDRVCEGQMPRLYVRQWPGLYLHRLSESTEPE